MVEKEQAWISFCVREMDSYNLWNVVLYIRMCKEQYGCIEDARSVDRLHTINLCSHAVNENTKI